ncbi:zinc finger CCCH domain-containing protein 55-like isoform X2 [Malania oleifera]|uniref:zinc finger CCCH domain-containing protein 55-like isoform X2 n=1 Tax=Malania oleifera TaxID=397392 RepID=UPI0025AEBAD1|nr:zinc finger CCCH domain-containing protein 55-like isoform X2 [Malania oleifera]XP_057972441.1 zinc finger CCCH domain-containing protein 55-like isoform X2 [Malania oleifera]
MSRSGRKRHSKWDLKEVPQLPLESVQADDRSGKSNLPFYGKEPQPGQRASEVAGPNGKKKWGSQNNESNYKDNNKYLEGTMAWDADGSYGMKMSPGFDEWRQQNRTPSPKGSWSRSLRGRSWSRSRSRSRSWSRSRSRSRSRSPARGFKRESGVTDRRSRSGGLAQPCRDFAAGRCRRGDHCQFLHHANQNYEDKRHSESGLADSWESRKISGSSKYANLDDVREYPMRSGRSVNCCNDFLKGRCRRGESCKYVHHSASDGLGKSDGNDMLVDRGKDRSRDASSERIYEHEPRRNGDIPCKFYAAGNCRKGRYCRFSHQSQTYSSLGGRSHDDRWRVDHNLDKAEQWMEGPKWSDTNNILDPENLSEVKNGKMGTPETRITEWPMDDRLDCHLDKEKGMWIGPTNNDKAVESNDKICHQYRSEKNDSELGVSKQVGTEKWICGMENSAAWDYGVYSPNDINKKEPVYTTQSSQSLTSSKTSLPMHEPGIITHEPSGQMHCTAAAIQPMIFKKSFCQQNLSSIEGDVLAVQSDDKNAIEHCPGLQLDLNFSADVLPCQNFEPNGNNSSTKPLSSLNLVGQGQPAFPKTLPRGEKVENAQNHGKFSEGESNKPDNGDAKEILSTQNMVSGEQLAQLTNLSASLAQLFESGQQLPQLYAALNSTTATEYTPSLANSAGPVAPAMAAPILPNLTAESQKQYDPICDSIEPIMPGGPNDGNSCKTGILEDLNHAEPVPNCEVNESNGIAARESKKADEEETPGNGLLLNVDTNGKVDEGKKSKDAKGIRAFKFSLVEFVKELLKPTWKDGQISKEAYKIIVKKVVDKVTSTVQGAHIPQTQEKIDHYLSFSKPKLTKLVQAYLEKHQKS